MGRGQFGSCPLATVSGRQIRRLVDWLRPFLSSPHRRLPAFQPISTQNRHSGRRPWNLC